MLRTLLAAILAVSAAAACGSKEDAPAATPGAPVGKVLEIDGTVTATRGTAVRTLTTGGEISTDDEIATAADGRVVILIAHNNARWDLGPNRTSRVNESLAWTAAKQAGPAAVVKEETSTAGRHAEKTAATTATTTSAENERAKEEARDPGAEAAPAVPAEPSTAAKDTLAAAATMDKGGSAPDRSSGGAPPDRKTAAVPPPPKVAKPASRSPGSTAPSPLPPPPTTDARALGGKPNTVAVPSNGRAKPTTRGFETATAPADNDGPDLQTKGGGGSPTTGAGGDSTGNDDARPTTPLELEIRATLRKQNRALQVCLGTDLSGLVVRVTVADGVYTILTTDPKATKATRECLAKVAKTLKATAKGTFSTSHAIAK